MRRLPARLREALAVAAGSVTAAVAFTWPLVLDVQHRVRETIDTLFMVWEIDWVQHAIDHGQNPYNANIFLPEKTTLAFSDTFFGIAIPTLPLRWMGFNAVGVYNVALILGFAGAAAAAYVFVKMVTGSRLAGAVGGAAYAFGPFGAFSAYHVHMAAKVGPPLAAAVAWWLADRAESGKSLRWPAVALASVLVWQTTVSFYPGTYAVVVAVVVLLVRARSLGWRGARAAAAGLGVTALCGILLAIPNFVVAGRQPSYKLALSTFGPYGANFFRTQPDLVVWGSVLGIHAGDTQLLTTFPGVTIVVLALIGAICAWREGGRRRTVAVTGLALTAVGGLLAIGTSATGWRQYAPYRLLYEIGPPFNALRATGRAWMIGLCGLCLLAGVGAVALAGWLQPRLRTARVNAAVLVGVLAVVLLLLEGFDPWFDRPTVHISAVDTELARRPEPGGVLYLPVNQGGNHIDLSYFQQPLNLLGLTAHHRKSPNGLSGFVPPSYFKNSRRFRTLPDAASLRLMRHLGVRFVVVHANVEGGPWAKLRDPEHAKPLKYLGAYGEALLYEVPQV